MLINIAKLQKWMFVFLICLLTGCEFNPNVHVHSETCPPDHRTEDGVWWSALKCSGDNDEWFFVPSEAAVVSRNRELSNGCSLKILLQNGRVYQLTKADGNFTFDGYVDADVNANPGMIDLVLVLGIVTVLAVFLGFHGLVQNARTGIKLESDREELAEAEAKCTELQHKMKDERRALASEKLLFEQQLQATDERHAAESAALKAEREELEQRKKTNAVASRDAALKPHAPTPEQWEAASETVRARAFSGQAVGNGLVINYFLDPRRSGMIRFHWEITLDQAFPPRIVGYRDGRKFREESGLVKNEFSDRLLHPDRRYKYKFKLFNGSKALPDPAVFEVIAPPFAAWEPVVPQPDSDAERRRKREAWRQDQYRYAESYISDPAKLKAKKAEIDEEANKKFRED